MPRGALERMQREPTAANREALYEHIRKLNDFANSIRLFASEDLNRKLDTMWFTTITASRGSTVSRDGVKSTSDIKERIGDQMREDLLIDFLDKLRGDLSGQVGK